MMKNVFRLLRIVGFAGFALACHDDGDTGSACIPDSEVSCGGGAPRRSTIDIGEGFELDPGEGVGAFVEYDGDGLYRISTTCDSAFTGYSCYFDMLLSVPEGGELLDYEPDNLDGDSLGFIEPGILSYRSVTEYDVDSFTIQTDPGAVLAVDLLLDCSCGNPYLFWVGDGAIHGGSPSNPLELEPNAP